jgi:bifunctional UDP-N-acetylglucosamine pyrophosphorylase/glucosamine-1-phosphate N-acetyltransferase
MLGTNDRAQLTEAAELLKKRINLGHMLSGVTIEDPNNTYIGPDVKIGQDTIIAPGTTILGNSVIGIANEIGPNTYLKNMKIGNNNTIIFSHLVDSEICNNIKIGPFARMRQNALVKDGSRIGNFVELKNTTFHEGVKAGHLAYMGDAELGAHTNVGAGAITANYDGVNKSKTIIGKNVFVGSNTTLVAPLNVGEGSYLAAASIINRDVPKDSLAIARSHQENKEGYAIKIREKQQKK